MGPEPGQRLVLLVNGGRLSIPADLDRRSVVPDPLPTALLMSAAWQLLPVLPTYGSLPWQRAAWPAGGTLALALAAKRRVCAGGSLEACRVLAPASVLAMWSSLMATTGATKVLKDDGEPLIGFFGPFAAHQVLAGFCLHRLSTCQRVVALGGAAACFIVLWRFLPTRPGTRLMLAEAVAPVVATAFGHSLALGYAGEAQRAASLSTLRDLDLVSSSFDAGRARVRAVVERALADARASASARRESLTGEVADEVWRRLDEVEADLRALNPPAT